MKELQRFLARNSSIFPEGNITGFFGHQTEQAVKRYQHKFGIFVFGTFGSTTTTGYFGPKTRKFFENHCDEINDDNDDNNDNNQTDHRNNENQGDKKGSSRDN